MRKSKLFGLAFLITIALSVSVIILAAAYLPSPDRPPAPSGKPSLTLPHNDSAVKVVSGFGTGTHNDVTFKTHTHYGLDFGKDWSPFQVIASAGGRLTYATWTAALPSGDPTPGCPEDIDSSKTGSQARVAIIDHNNGWRTIYMHLGSYLVPDNSDVSQGQVIGTAGCSGAKWPHLHFELRHYTSYPSIDGVWSYNPEFTNCPSGASYPSACGPSSSPAPLASSLDVLFVIDTTQSMVDDIDRVKVDATRIINNIKDVSPNARIAVMDFRDFPSRTVSSDYPYRDVLPFTYDRNEAINAIRSLSLGNGGDVPESINCALMHAFDNNRCAGQGANTTIGPWASTTKRVILMTDSTALDPEPFTGFTRSQVTARARAGGFQLQGIAEDGYGGEPPPPEGIAIYPVIIRGDPSAIEYGKGLAVETGGKLFSAGSANDVVNTLLGAISEVVNHQAPEIVHVETFREGGLVFYRLFFTDPSNTAVGFGFKGVNGSLWGEENHPFSSPSFGRMFPGIIEYPFNHLCGTPSAYESDVEVWIYDSVGHRSPSVTVHLACSAPSESGAPNLQPTGIIFDPSTAVVGRAVFFDSGVRNTGDVDTGVFNIKWFVDGQEVGAYGSHAGVPARQAVMDGNSQFSWTFASPGLHLVTFSVDVDNHVLESNESDNSTTTYIVVKP